MKSTFGWSLFAFAIAAAPAFSQDVDVKAKGGQVKVQAPGTRVEAEIPGGAARDNKFANSWRASKLIGANVQNKENKSLGTVNDLVMDDRGHAHYMILGHGGVLGVGQKLFAVPMGAISFHRTQDDGQYVLFNIAPEVLEKGTGFTSDTVPDFTKEKVRQANDAFYTDAGVKINVDVDRTPDRAPIRNR